jgi:hypothetical protein
MCEESSAWVGYGSYGKLLRESHQGPTELNSVIDSRGHKDCAANVLPTYSAASILC